MLLSKVRDSNERDRIRAEIATAYASQKDSKNASKWLDRVEDSDVRACAKEQVASVNLHPFENLEPDPRRSRGLLFCGTQAAQFRELRKELEYNPESVWTRLLEEKQSVREEASISLFSHRNRYLNLVQSIGEVLGSDAPGQKLLAGWKVRLSASPLEQAYLYIGAAKASQSPVIAVENISEDPEPANGSKL
jgi:hypothetical protein